MSAVEESLIGQITDQVQALPEDLRQQVLDSAGYLRDRYVSGRNVERDQPVAATFGSWQDEREVEQIIQDIYAQRTISEPEYEL